MNKIPMLKNGELYKFKSKSFFVPAGSRVQLSGLYDFVIYELMPDFEDEKKTKLKDLEKLKTCNVIAAVRYPSVFKQKFVRDIIIRIECNKENVYSYLGMNPLDHKFRTTDEILTIKVPQTFTNSAEMMKSIVSQEIEARNPEKETAEEADDFEMDDVEFGDSENTYVMEEDAWEAGSQYRQMVESMRAKEDAQKARYKEHVRKAAEQLALEQKNDDT